MRALSLTVFILLSQSLAANAGPCRVDGQCGYGKRCIIPMGERIGTCEGITDKFGNLDRSAMGTANENKAADSVNNGKASCNWDADCGSGLICRRQGNAVSGICGH